MRPLPVFLLIIGVLLSLGAEPAFAQNTSEAPLTQRATELVTLFNNHSGSYDSYFSSDFLSQLPSNKLTAIFAYYSDRLGKCLRVNITSADSPLSASLELVFEKEFKVPATIAVESAEPHKIIRVWFGNPVAVAGSFDELLKQFKLLPGESSLTISKLNSTGLEQSTGYNQDAELAIGSSFKLYILSELMREIASGGRKWQDVTFLKPALQSLPTGILQSWPDGSPVTLHTLATLMISVSDNTAADHLLFLLGRTNVEKVLPLVGHSRPEMDAPFLSTLEAFKLKWSPDKTLADKYASKDAAGRREMLENLVPGISKQAILPSIAPTNISAIEWFASTSDLCRAVAWIKQNSETGPNTVVRGILSVNPGLAISRTKWKYVGYKGGSEPGVMNMTYLLQSSSGNWFVLSATWNNPNAPVDENKLESLVSRAIELIE